MAGSGQEVAKHVGKAELRAHATFGGTRLPLRSCMASLKQGSSRGFLPRVRGQSSELALGMSYVSGEQSPADHSRPPEPVLVAPCAPGGVRPSGLGSRCGRRGPDPLSPAGAQGAEEPGGLRELPPLHRPLQPGAGVRL